MLKKSPKVPTAVAIWFLICAIGVVVLPLVFLSTSGILKYVSGALLVAVLAQLFLAVAGKDPISAWQNERLSEQQPWLNRNEDIGRVAVAVDDFVSGDDCLYGKVEVNGETWDARCSDSDSIRKGDKVVILARDSLSFEVSPPNKALH